MKLDAIGIVSRDLANSIAFYRLLGLDFAGPAGMDHLEAKTSSGIRLMLDSENLIKKLVPGWVRQVGNGMVLAFDGGSPAEVDSMYKIILAAGHEGTAESWDAFWGQRYACVVDPDGNQIDLFANLNSPDSSSTA